MSEVTKTCNLTQSEIRRLISSHGSMILDDTDDTMERLNYLHKRLKSFSDPKIEPIAINTDKENTDSQQPKQVATNPLTDWPTA